MRLWSSEPVLVRQTTSYPPAQVGRSARTVSWCGEIALQALHLALTSELRPPRPPVMRGLAYAAELERLMLMPEHAALLMDGGGGARILALTLSLTLTLTLTLSNMIWTGTLPQNQKDLMQPFP